VSGVADKWLVRFLVLIALVGAGTGVAASLGPWVFAVDGGLFVVMPSGRVVELMESRPR
jgi:hypothetical protein